MEYRRLGPSGIHVSTLCLGTYNFGNVTDERTAHQTIQAAADAGINFIDTADSYASGESERIIGRYFTSADMRRRVVLASKVFYPTEDQEVNNHGLSRHHIITACEASLRRLRTDYLDLYLAHRPAFDVPIEETLAAFDLLVRQGKVLYIGSSTFPGWKIVEAVKVSEIRKYASFICESPPYNLLDRRVENEIVPACLACGLGIVPWSPIAMGMLAGRYRLGTRPPAGSRAALDRVGIYANRISAQGLRVASAVSELCTRWNLTAGQLSLLWVKDQPGVTAVIVGPRTPDQLKEMLGIADMRADQALRAAFDQLNPPGAAVANFYNTSGWMKDAVSAEVEPCVRR